MAVDPAAPASWLQRGRAPKSAESGAGTPMRSQNLRLQRGRAPKSAESRTSATRWLRENLLQRGRAPKSAESMPPTTLQPPIPLASTGPRSEERGVKWTATRCRTRDTLQRGRAPKSAESTPTLTAGSRWAGASTGPRSEERGVAASPAPTCAASSSLQRGRAPKSAESPYPRPPVGSSQRFNGAALRRARSPHFCKCRRGSEPKSGLRAGVREAPAARDRRRGFFHNSLSVRVRAAGRPHRPCRRSRLRGQKTAGLVVR